MPPETPQADASSTANDDRPMNKRALIIGVNAYPDSKTSKKPVGDLQGCVNDALLMRSVLRDKFGVAEEGIRFLSSPAPEGQPEDLATRANILAGFEELIEKTGTGDMVVVYFAGHGSRVKDRDLDEGSGMDSSILPCDAIRWSSKDEFVTDEVLDITDDEVHVKLLRLAEKTDNVTLVFDSCHSGTMSRGPGDPHMVARQAPEDERPLEMLAPVQYTEEEKALLAESRRKSASGWAASAGKYVMISGCRDSEFSYETEVPGARGDETVKHGALTYYLVEALRSAKPGDTYRDVFERLAPKVMANNSSQHPQIDGTQDREIFGTREFEPLAYVRVVDVQGTQVTLDGGAAHGLTVGSIWRVHPEGTRASTDESRTGEIEITEVRATKSFATIVEGSEPAPAAIQANQWAVEKERDYGDRRMKVRLQRSSSDDVEGWKTLEDGIASMAARIERLEDDTGASVKVILVAPRDEVDRAKDLAPQVGPVHAPTVAVVNESGDLMMPPKPATAEGIGEALANLDGWAQYRYKLAIDNPGSSLAKRVSFEILHRKSTADPWAPLRAREGESLPVVETGDLIKVRLINHGPGQVYCGVLDFLINGAVEPSWSGWLQEKRPEQPHVELQSSDEGSPVTWEGGFPFDPNPYVESPNEGVEVLKLFITMQETNFDALAQQSASRSQSNPLEELLANPTGATRGVKLAPVDDWGTISFPFILRAPTEAALEPEKAVAFGGGADRVQVTASGVTGTVRLGGKIDVGGVERPPPFDEESPAARLRRLLEQEGLVPKQALTVGDSSPVGSASRGSGDPEGVLTIETEQSDPEWGEVLMSTDDAGLVRWHFPVDEADPPTGARGGPAPEADGRGARRKRTYRIAPPTVDDASPRSRGPMSAALGRLFVDRIAFPMLGPAMGAAVEAWESRFWGNRVRWFGPGDVGSDQVREVSGDDWRRLGEGRTLLFLHGPFSRAHKTFRDLTPEYLAELAGRYGDRMIALDHMTLTHDPRQNIEWFVNQLPEETKLDMDVIAHSRGGLVGRVLAEQGQDLAFQGREIRVGSLVLTGSPSGGTALADPQHLESALSLLTNLFSAFDPTIVTGPIVQLVQKLATGTAKELDGLQAMAPGGSFLSSLGKPTPNGTQYFGVASDITSSGSDKLSRKLLDRMVKKVLGDGANDLFVPEASVWGRGEGLPFAEKKTLTGSDAPSHLGYFEVPAVRREIATWLGRDGAPIVVETREPVASGRLAGTRQPPAGGGGAGATEIVPASAAGEADVAVPESTAVGGSATPAQPEPVQSGQRVNGGEPPSESGVDDRGSRLVERERGALPRLPGSGASGPPRPPGRRGTDPPRLPGSRH